jgi:hypothetical protein
MESLGYILVISAIFILAGATLGGLGVFAIVLLLLGWFCFIASN